MSEVTAREILTGENYLSEYKGAFTEVKAKENLK